MNNGKICVSVCAETADELIEQIKHAEDLADIIEIRFDCLDKSELSIFDDKKRYEFYKKLPATKKSYLTTFRPKEQGGSREITREERDHFWNSGYETEWADCEEDIIEDSFYWLWKERICSYHDFDGVPDDLIEIYERLKATNADVVKIAVRAYDITDTISLWKLLERWKSERESLKAKKLKEIEELNRKLSALKNTVSPPDTFLRIIPIAMGESGKWTRILGLAHGAFMTYASLDSGSETAPGQVSARDLREVYRAKELDETTEVYGILGGSTGVSLSPYMHNAAFRYHNLNAVFVPLQAHDLNAFMRRMVKPATREIELNFRGFSVTIPHKRSIIEHLDYLDETARKIGAVNTVKIEGGKLYGYNTDAEGFLAPLLDSYGDLTNTRVAVLGAGGAARACVYALQTAGARPTVFARDLTKARSLADDFQVELKELPKTENRKPKTLFTDFDILVNTTPLGMKGKFENETPATADELAGLQLVYDLVYTPFQTRLMAEADKAEVPKIGGLAMLVAQGAAQQKIWTNLEAPVREMSRAALERLR
ncbi:MAG TPA: shikimate dehydrogenase [Pyrinomonadaceae bacterium]|jgi:3-dehydroquinate dehydratase/shikimate dehydrogenase